MAIEKFYADQCLLACCRHGGGPWCKHCGWNVKEVERREAIPLTLGEDGLRRKYLGLTVEESSMEYNEADDG